jgi:CRP-like cAMP-binding protein
VRAEVQTDVLMLGRSDFARCMPESSSMAYAVMRVLVRRLRHSVRNIESLALMDVYGRLARVLLENAQRDANGCLVIHDKISRLDLAKMVGASREMVTRVMKDLEQRGFVTVRLDGAMVVKEHLDTLV